MVSDKEIHKAFMTIWQGFFLDNIVFILGSYSQT